MKRKSFLLLLLTIHLYSCSLDTEEPQFSGEDFQNLFNLSYNDTRNYIDAFYYLNEVTTDEMIPLSATGGWSSNQTWDKLHQHTWDAQDPIVLNLWNQAYGGIELCTSALSNAEASNTSFIAELRVLRGFYYYQLLDCFGGVPILDEDFINSPLRSRVNRTELFNYIETEITAALPDLSDMIIYGRINKDVANTILAKLYLNAAVYTGEPAWEKCKLACQAILDASNFNLKPDYFDNFSVDNQITGLDEIIFYSIFDAEALSSGTQMDLQARSAHPIQLGVSDEVRNPFFAVPASFYNRFDLENDYRAEAFLVGLQLINEDANAGIPYLDTKGNELNFTEDIPTFPITEESTGIRVLKYQIDPASNRYSSNNDFAIFRLSDIYLMLAEAHTHLNERAEAAEFLNRVRTRAYQGTEQNIDLTTGEFFNSELLNLILAERGKELFWEGFRRQDLIRFNQFCEAWLFKNPDDDCAKRILFPIPQRIIDANPGMVQNPGY